MPSQEESETKPQKPKTPASSKREDFSRGLHEGNLPVVKKGQGISNLTLEEVKEIVTGMG